MLLTRDYIFYTRLCHMSQTICAWYLMDNKSLVQVPVVRLGSLNHSVLCYDGCGAHEGCGAHGCGALKKFTIFIMVYVLRQLFPLQKLSNILNSLKISLMTFLFLHFFITAPRLSCMHSPTAQKVCHAWTPQQKPKIFVPRNFFGCLQIWAKIFNFYKAFPAQSSSFQSSLLYWYCAI